MKKSILIAVLGMSAAVVAYGQGQVNFSNYYASGQPTGIQYGNGSDVGQFVGSEMTATLLFGASTDTLISQLAAAPGSATAIGAFGATTPSANTFGGAGIVSGPTLTLGVGTFAFAIEVTGTFNSQTYTGVSAIFVGSTNPSNLLPPANLPSGLTHANIFVTSVPEPTSMALGGLGLAALLVARRKKA
jgi:hypothetical protein